MSFRSIGLLTALAAVLCIGSTAFAETIIYQEGANDPFTGLAYAGTEDNFMMDIPHLTHHHDYRNYGAYAAIAVGINGDPGASFHRRGLIRFDLSSLVGKYASIDTVTLRLHSAGGGVVNSANNLQLFHLTAANENWVEGTAGGANQTGSSCWAYRAYDATAPTPWDSGLPGTEAADYDGSAIASAAFSSVPTGWMNLAFTDLSVIDGWAAGNNPGMVLRVSDESPSIDSVLDFHSAEYDYGTGSNLRPQLVIDYTPIPEPSSLVLLVGLGLLGFAAWRRR